MNMKLIKVNNSDFFGAWSSVSLKGETLNYHNIRNYDLIKVWEDDGQEVFKINKSSTVVIVLNKSNHMVDWYDDIGEGYDGFPDTFYEKTREYWIKYFNVATKRDIKLNELGI
jgi:hypothetical protein